jgi:hypothetical protein
MDGNQSDEYRERRLLQIARRNEIDICGAEKHTHNLCNEMRITRISRQAKLGEVKINAVLSRILDVLDCEIPLA